jgi:S1-C subfamily serine protease
VVAVKAYDQKGKPVGQGSGVMLPSGDIITNYHVVKEGVRYTEGRGKQAAPATLKAGDPDKDLCLLTAPGIVAEPVRLGKTARLKVGEPVYAVGTPQGVGTVPVRRDYLPTAGWRPSSNNPDHGGYLPRLQRWRLVQCER